MLQQFLAIFLVNFLTSIDNAIVLAGIANRYKNLLVLGAVSSIVITVCRTALIMGIVSVTKWPGFRLTLGLAVLIVAFNIANASSEETRDKSGFWRVLFVVIATDLALSVDNIMSIAIISKNVILIALSVFLSLFPLFMLLPVMVKVMDQLAWLRILAAGFVAELAIDSITDDPFVAPHAPKGHMELFLRAGFALLVILYGVWRTYLKQQRAEL